MSHISPSATLTKATFNLKEAGTNTSRLEASLLISRDKVCRQNVKLAFWRNWWLRPRALSGEKEMLDCGSRGNQGPEAECFWTCSQLPARTDSPVTCVSVNSLRSMLSNASNTYSEAKTYLHRTRHRYPLRLRHTQLPTRRSGSTICAAASFECSTIFL